MQQVRNDETSLLSCPNISLTERWWREFTDLVDIYDPITCEEYPESATHPDRYEINTQGLNPGDTLDILVCKVDGFDKNIIEMSATPGPDCTTSTCPPTVSCPAEFKLRKDFNCNYSIPDFTSGVTLTNHCDGPAEDVTDTYTIMQMPPPGSIITEETFIEILVYDEDGALVATCDVFVTLADDPPPEMDEPFLISDIIFGDELPSFQDINAYDTLQDGTVINLQVETSVETGANDPCLGYDMTYIWMARDTCGNTTTKRQTFSVLPDERAPLFVSVPVDIDTILAGEPFPLLVDLIAVSEDGSAQGVQMTKEVLPYEENLCQGYPVTYRWTASDSCGNMAEISKSFYVKPVNAPPIFLTSPSAISNILASQSLPTPEILKATNAAGYDSGIEVKHVIDPYVQDPCNPYPVTYRWIAQDSCNNVASVSTTFQVIPDTVDFGAMPAMEDINLAIEASCQTAAAITIPIDLSRYDNVAIDITLYDDQWSIISEESYIDGMEYNFEAGTSYLVYSFSDLCDRSMKDTIKVQASDLTAPTFNCYDNSQVFVSDFTTCLATIAWSEPAVVDNCPGTTVTQLSGPSSGSQVPVGIYTIVYEATDQSGNSTTCSFDVTVSAITASRFICEPIIVDLDNNCEAEITRSLILTQEQFGCADGLGLIVQADRDTITTEVIQLGQYLDAVITYTICDPVTLLCCSNEIILKDNNAPELICSDPITVSCYDEINPYRPTVVGECGPVTWRISEQALTDECVNEQVLAIISRTYIAIDEAGNESPACSQEFVIEYAQIDSLDELGLILFPPDTIIQCDDIDINNSTLLLAGVPLINGKAIHPDSSICGLDIKYTDEVLFTDGCEKGILRKWQIHEDLCHRGFNVVQGEQLIRVTDTIAPVIESIVDTITLFTDVKECYGYLYDPALTITDNCEDVSSIKVDYIYNRVNFQQYEPLPLPLGINHVIVSATDKCGNIGYDTLIVQVVDLIRPVAVCYDENVVTLAGSRSSVYVGTIDAGTYDNCELASIEIRREDATCTPQDTIWGDNVHFCCEDIGKKILVILRATDYAGNVNICSGYVDVHDKLAPIVTCPPDITVECAADVQPSNNQVDPYGHLFGTINSGSDRSALGLDKKYVISASGALRDGEVTDQCIDNINIEVATDADVNECGIGTIRRTFVAIDGSGNRSVPCTQTIQIIGGEAIDTSLITWPTAEMTIDACESIVDISEERLGKPTIAKQTCTLYGISSEDTYYDVQGNTGGACTKIIRSWTIINWCSPHETKGVTRYQTIKITDTEAPVIDKDCNAEIYVSGISPDCRNVPVRLTINTSDNCTPTDVLDAYVRVDLYANGSIDREVSLIYDDSSSALLWIDTLISGDHAITWVVTDKCGNETTCRQKLLIEDSKPPTPYAHGINLTIATEGYTDIWASDLKVKATDPCGAKASYLLGRAGDDINQADDYLRLSCSDIGETLVKVYAYRRLADGSITSDFTTVTIDLQDNRNVCGDNPSSEQEVNAMIEGRVKTSYGVTMPYTEVMLTNVDDETMVLTDNAGWYEYDHLQPAPYIVKPYMEDIARRGLSTIDAILIQRHIMGITTLYSPWDQIAADVTKDHRISAIDIVELRKALLGAQSKMDTYEPWSFLPTRYRFKDSRHALEEHIDYNIPYDGRRGNQRIDITAIKVGDLDKSVAISELIAKKRSTSSINVVTTTKKDMHTEINLILPKSQILSGFQVGLELPMMSNVSSITGSKQMDIAYNSSNGNILISAMNERSQVYEAGDTLVSITVPQNIHNTNIQLSHTDILRSELYDEDLNPSDLRLNILDTNPANKAFRFSPNPFGAGTSVSHYSPMNTTGEIIIFNTQGQRVYYATTPIYQGQNTLKVNGNEVLESGLLIYKVQIGESVYRGKVIKQ